VARLSQQHELFGEGSGLSVPKYDLKLHALYLDAKYRSATYRLKKSFRPLNVHHTDDCIALLQRYFHQQLPGIEDLSRLCRFYEHPVPHKGCELRLETLPGSGRYLTFKVSLEHFEQFPSTG